LARSFGAGAAGYGVLSGVWSAGVIAGSRLAASVVRTTGEQLALVAGTAAMALAVAAVALLPSFSAIIAAGALAGAGTGIAFAPWLTLMQRKSDDQLRGIIMATANTWRMLVWPAVWLPPPHS
jgi:dTMP kinase